MKEPVFGSRITLRRQSQTCAHCLAPSGNGKVHGYVWFSGEQTGLFHTERLKSLAFFQRGNIIRRGRGRQDVFPAESTGRRGNAVVVKKAVQHARPVKERIQTAFPTGARRQHDNPLRQTAFVMQSVQSFRDDLRRQTADGQQDALHDRLSSTSAPRPKLLCLPICTRLAKSR